MESLSTCAPARPLPCPREPVASDPGPLQQLAQHLDALERQTAEIPSRSLRILMGLEISRAREALRLLGAARDTSPILTLAERGLEDLKACSARGEYPEGCGCARATLAQIVADLGPSPR